MRRFGESTQKENKFCNILSSANFTELIPKAEDTFRHRDAGVRLKSMASIFCKKSKTILSDE